MTLRIVFIGNAISTMLHFRGPLIKTLTSSGHEVVALCPGGSDEDVKALCGLGARHVELKWMSRQGMNPVSEIRLVQELTAILKELKPDRVFAYFLKPVIWSSLAARLACVPRTVGMIEGMGFAFSHPAKGLRARLRQFSTKYIILALLRLLARYLDHLIVLNSDDQTLMLRHGIVKPENLTVIDGIGVDLDHFSPSNPSAEPVRFTFVGRLLKEKGIFLFVAAAEKVKEEFPDVEFQLVGGLDDAPGAITKLQVERWVATGSVEWAGQVSDVRNWLKASSIFVLPTLYREGLPRSTMEAMATGRAVITSDMPGARQSITHNGSGIIVPSNDLPRLIEACKWYCNNPMEREKMGVNARQEAQVRYDLSARNTEQIAILLGQPNQ